MPTIQQIKARRAAYKQRVEQAGSVKAAEQDMREVVAQYQANRQAGMTAAEAQSNGVPAVVNAPQTYTVTNQDNISTVASSLNTTPQDLLKANPDVTKIQTGMVLNAPTPITAASYTPAYQQYADRRLPTAAGPAPARVDNWMQEDKLQNQGYRRADTQLVGGMLGLDKPFNQNFQSTPQPTQPQSPQQPVVTNKPPNWAGQLNNIILNNLLDKITAETGSSSMKYGRVPSDWEMKLLIDNKRVIPVQKQAATQTGGGGYYGRSYGRGGGGGGGGGSGGSSTSRAQQYSEPPFSSGTGFRGLINWRI